MRKPLMVLAGLSLVLFLSLPIMAQAPIHDRGMPDMFAGMMPGLHPGPAPDGMTGQKSADDGTDWRALRQQILLADLQATTGLTDEQMTTLQALAVELRDNVIAKRQEIRDLLEQIRDLRRSWTDNFEQIIHLEYQIHLKQYEIGELRRGFSTAVDGVLASGGADYKPLVIRILWDAYGLDPKPNQQPPQRPE